MTAAKTATYESDFYTWARAQADALRRRSANAIDWEHVAEEIEALSRTEARELASRYEVLLAHLLKWIVQPERRTRSWRNTIEEYRERIADHLDDNPGLKSRDEELFLAAYELARLSASSETDLDLAAFPEHPPFSRDEAAGAWWPA